MGQASRLGAWAKTGIMQLLIAAGLTLVLGGAPALWAQSDPAKSDEQSADSDSWKQHWAVPEGFSIEIDSEGYHYPTGIAFVPNPGNGPKDPLYFVTELRGKVKVVTNDRTVHTFAQGFLNTEFYEEPPSGEAEFGLGSICLDPAHGYVFATFAYQDKDKLLRNNIIRFETKPETFALKPDSQRAFTDVFKHYESGASHQIGGCAVHDDTLYVSIGDGFKSPLNGQRLNALLGKIIRMDLDGRPLPTNPFYQDDDIHKARNYVWAYGFRNPFSMESIGGHIMIAENGVALDRFLEVKKGQNYLWDGTDKSMASNASYVWLDSQGPIQMDSYPTTATYFPKPYAGQICVGMSKPGSVMCLGYDVRSGELLSVPQYLVSVVRQDHQAVSGLAFGPDALYFSPMIPLSGYDDAVVLKLKYDPDHAHDVTLMELADAKKLAEDGRQLMREKGCFGCHKLAGVFDLGGTKGPVLNRGEGPMVERIEERVNSEAFIESLRQLNQRDKKQRYIKERNAVIDAQGRARVHTWMKYQILDPAFDGPTAMPDQGLHEIEAEAITRYLLAEPDAGPTGLTARIKAMLPKPRYRYFAYFFGAGFLLALPFWMVLQWLGRRWRRRP
jgi:glucose/arabinose dehydrogenase